MNTEPIIAILETDLTGLCTDQMHNASFSLFLENDLNLHLEKITLEGVR